MVERAPTRPALRWHGGKWLLALWIIQHFPRHRVYVEPYGGAGNVLLRKPRCYAEVYNDLDGAAVNLFRVLRGPRAAELLQAVRLTPFAREEFEQSYVVADDEVEEARRLLVRCFMGFGSDGHNRRTRTGFRANSNRSGTTPAHDWRHYPDALALVVERFRGVVIENRDALLVMQTHDSSDTLHYLDPPYLPETRSTKSRKTGEKYYCYTHEMTLDDHVAMLEAIKSLKGMVVLSGYPAPLYNEALTGWHRVERASLADGARKRVEVLWLNPACERHAQGEISFAESATCLTAS